MACAKTLLHKGESEYECHRSNINISDDNLFVDIMVGC